MGKKRHPKATRLMITADGGDLTNNVGWVSVGIDRDTATFAVNTVGVRRKQSKTPLL
jgi:hypothetical protein